MNALPVQPEVPAPKKAKKVWIIAVVVLLILCCLCSLIGAGVGYYFIQNGDKDISFDLGNNSSPAENSVESPATPQEKSTQTAPKPAKPTQKPLIQLPNLPGVKLGDEVRLEKCGYSFKNVPDFKNTAKDCWTILWMPGEEEIQPPGIKLSSTVKYGQSEYDTQVKFLEENKDVTIISKNKIKIGGVDGNSWDFEEKGGDKTYRSRSIMIMVTPNQFFQISALASPEKWDELLPYYEAVVKSVSFFEPK
ncbi:MAG: hypothetical protein WCG34_01570 [Leptolinea sp.]